MGGNSFSSIDWGRVANQRCRGSVFLNTSALVEISPLLGKDLKGPRNGLHEPARKAYDTEHRSP